MKKVLFLSLIFFLGLALAGYSPVKADSVVVNGSYTETDTLSQADYDDLQNTALLLKYLQNGGVIDTSNVSAGYSVSDLVSDFGNFVKEVVPDLIDVINPFQSKFEYTPLGNAMLNNNIYKFMGQLPFYALSQSDDNPEPSPDPDYNSYLERINGRDSQDGSKFWFYNAPEGYQANQTVRYSVLKYPFTQYSWVAQNANANIFGTNPNSFSTAQMVAMPIIDLYIYSDNGTYSYYYTGTSDGLLCMNNAQEMVWNTIKCTATGWDYLGYRLYWYGGNSGSVTVTHSLSNATLDAVLEDIAEKFKNINIYVDDIPWSIVGSSQSYSIQLYNNTVPDIATNDYGYVHWVYDYEIYYRIDQIWGILQDILDNMGNGGSTIIRWPDIDDVIVDVDGQPAVAVKIYTPDNNIDEEYWSKYGPLVPVFIPLATPVINDSDILLIAETPMSALPDDLLDVFGYIFIGMLFVCFIHRLLE